MSAGLPRLLLLHRRGYRASTSSRAVLVRPDDPGDLPDALDAVAATGMTVLAVADLTGAVGLLEDHRADVVASLEGGALGELEIAPVYRPGNANGAWVQPPHDTRRRPQLTRTAHGRVSKIVDTAHRPYGTGERPRPIR